MCSSLTNNPRSPIATSNLSKSNWDKKATFKKKKILDSAAEHLLVLEDYHLYHQFF